MDLKHKKEQENGENYKTWSVMIYTVTASIIRVMKSRGMRWEKHKLKPQM